MTPDPLTGPAGFTRRLFLRGERAAVGLPLRRLKAPGGSPRLRWVADAVRKDALAWLVRRGGWRRRVVVCGGRRREGRVTDAGLFERLGVRFTAAPLHLLMAAIASPPPWPEVDAPLRAAVEASLGGPDPATGDLLALHRLVDRLSAAADARRVETGVDAGALRAPLGVLRQALQARAVAVVTPDGRLLAAVGDEAMHDLGPLEPVALDPKDTAFHRLDEGVFLRRLDPARALLVVFGRADLAETPPAQAALLRVRQGVLDAGGAAREAAAARRREVARLSPLTLLFQPEALGEVVAGDPADEAARVERAAQRLAPLFEGDRAALLTWLDDALASAWLDEEALRRTRPPGEARVRYEAAARGLGGLVRAARERKDALRPLNRFFRGYVLRFGGRAPVVEALREQARALDRASERDAFLASASRLFGVGCGLRDVVAATLATPVVDRDEPGKVLLADWYDGGEPIALEVEAIRRELAGEVG